MRKPEYLSPTAVKIWQENEEEYFMKYLADNRPDREPQTAAMAVGSAFDAFIKAYLHLHLYGKGHKNAAIYELDTIFAAQVEPGQRDQAREAGSYCFSAYKDCGALADLMFELDSSSSEPRFETTVMGAVEGRREGSMRAMGNVILLGKPDVYFINGKGAHVLLDWKVNGFYSKSHTSPMAGYRMVRDCHKPTKSHGQMHRDFIPGIVAGMEIDFGSYLEDRNKDWAQQLAIYGWLLGEPVGAEVIVAIDQIACAPNPFKDFPDLRVAQHRTRVSQAFQIKTIIACTDLWNRINEQPFWFFRDMSIEDSAKRCALLDQPAEEREYTADEKWLLDAARDNSYYGHKKA